MKRLGIIALSFVLALLVAVPPKGALPVASADTVKVTSDFEDGTLQGWGPRLGSETVTVAGTEGARTGTKGMSVANRTQTYHGASKNVLSVFTLGTSYTVRAYVKLAAGSANTNVTMSMQKTVGTTTTYENLVSTAANASGWVKLEATYRLSGTTDALSLYFESPGATLAFYVDDFEIIEIAATPIETNIASLKDVFAPYFPIGTAFLNDEMYGTNGQLMAKHFNSVTPGNNMKWDATEPTEGAFNLAGPDAAVQFAKSNGMKMRGHTLVWHSQTPNWVFYDSNNQLVTKEVLYARMKTHIQTLVTRYKDDIYAWDVANEVIDESQSDGMRRSLWYQIAGEEYIEKAFQYAHEADPDAKLFINDYNTHIPAKAQFLYDLVKRLKAKGVPIDGVGHQTHINIDYPALSQIEDSIVKFADLGVTQEITELDMSIYTSSSQSYASLSADLAQKQADRYKALFEIFKKHKDKITNVTFWGQDDAHSWLRSFPVSRLDWPLLFNDSLQAKPAYYSIVNAVTTPAVPAAPTNVTATAGDAQATIAWTASTGAASYNVKRATTSGGTYTTVATGVTGTTYTNTGLTNGTTYYYVVSAVNTAGESSNSPQVSATPQATVTVPGAFTLTGTAGNAQASLAWTASTGATSYKVQRATSSTGTYADLASNLTALSYVDTTAANGTTYYYRIAATNTAGTTNSNTATVTPAAPASVPGAFTLTGTAGNAQASLSWTASTGAASYNVERATGSGSYTTLATGLTGLSYTDTTAANGTTYSYRIAAVNTAGTTNSNVVTLTPTAPTTTSSLVVQYKTSNGNATDNQVYATFNIKNTGTSAVSLSNLKLRYYFTKETTSASLNYWVDYAQVGGSNITGAFATISPAKTNADTYLELSFSSAAGSVAAGGQSGEIQVRIAKSDWSNFNEANDHSFDGTKTAFADWNKVTLYQSGSLVWGIEP